MDFWLWFFGCIIALIAGFLLTFMFYVFITKGRDMLRVKFPKNKERTSDIVKDKPEIFENTNPGKPSEQDKKEVLEDERKRREKFREFEKLRQEELRPTNNNNSEGNRGTSDGAFYSPVVEELPGRKLLSNGPSERSSDSGGGTPRPKRRVKLDD